MSEEAPVETRRMYREFMEFHPPEGSYEPNDLFANIDGPWLELGSVLLDPENPIEDAQSMLDIGDNYGQIKWGTRILLVPQFTPDEDDPTGYESHDFTIATQAEDLGIPT